MASSSPLSSGPGHPLPQEPDPDSVCLTELKKVEDELRESECRYRAVVEQAAEGIMLFDVDSKRTLEANFARQNVLGYTPEAILRLTSYQFSEVLIASPEPP
jgi:PAS domain-containing protein